MASRGGIEMRQGRLVGWRLSKSDLMDGSPLAQLPQLALLLSGGTQRSLLHDIDPADALDGIGTGATRTGPLTLVARPLPFSSSRAFFGRPSVDPQETSRGTPPPTSFSRLSPTSARSPTFVPLLCSPSPTHAAGGADAWLALLPSPARLVAGFEF